MESPETALPKASVALTVTKGLIATPAVEVDGPWTNATCAAAPAALTEKLAGVAVEFAPSVAVSVYAPAVSSVRPLKVAKPLAPVVTAPA